MAITQEALHTIKTKKRRAFVLKLDLGKAFNRVNWTFLRLILLQIANPLLGVNWTMGCVPSSNYVVLINGTP